MNRKRKVAALFMAVILTLLMIPNSQATDWYDTEDARWTVSDHSSIVYLVTENSFLASAAKKPDIFDKDWIGVGGDEPNYFNTKQWLHGFFITTNQGGAPEKCKDWVDKAKEAYEDGDDTKGDQYIGYSLHYLVDMAQPMHTDTDLIQQAQWHIWYEKYVEENWMEKFDPLLDGYDETTEVKDPAQACMDLAKFSNSYLDELWDALRTNDLDSVEDITLICLKKAMSYVNGFMDMIEGYVTKIKALASMYCIAGVLVVVLIAVLVGIWVWKLRYDKSSKKYFK